MSNCDKFKQMLVLHAESALETQQAQEVGAHLAECAACRQEAVEIGRIREWLSDSELFAPESDYAWQILPQTLAARAQAEAAAKRWLPTNFGLRGWVFAFAATLVVCLGLVLLFHRPPVVAPVAQVTPPPGNEAFLGKIQSAYAREATSQYLGECQDLLINVMRAEKGCNGNMFDVSLEVSRARRLLQRKRMLDADLAAPEVSSARSLCDELEEFLVSLSTSDKCESPDKMRRMERYIKREQLLLRINVLQSELS